MLNYLTVGTCILLSTLLSALTTSPLYMTADQVPALHTGTDLVDVEIQVSALAPKGMVHPLQLQLHFPLTPLTAPSRKVICSWTDVPNYQSQVDCCTFSSSRCHANLREGVEREEGPRTCKGDRTVFLSSSQQSRSAYM